MLAFKASICSSQSTSKKFVEVGAVRAARLFFFIQPIISLFSGGVVAETPI